MCRQNVLFRKLNICLRGLNFAVSRCPSLPYIINMINTTPDVLAVDKKTLYVDAMLVKCWAGVTDGGPPSSHHFNVFCLLGKPSRDWVRNVFMCHVRRPTYAVV